MFRYNLPPALLAQWPKSFHVPLRWHGGWNGHRIRVSTQSWLWRRKFSRRSCRDLNSQPFDHESDALTNKLSRLLFSLYIKPNALPLFPHYVFLSVACSAGEEEIVVPDQWSVWAIDWNGDFVCVMVWRMNQWVQGDSAGVLSAKGWNNIFVQVPSHPPPTHPPTPQKKEEEKEKRWVDF